MSKICWICNLREATTREHIKKRGVIDSVFTNYSNQSGRRLRITYNDGRKKLAQGSKSDLFKYEENLCLECNSSKSAAWDNAYQDMVNYLIKNQDKIYQERRLDLRLIYKKELLKNCQVNLFRYFAKEFGCAIDNAGKKVPAEILDVVQGRSYGKQFYAIVSINEEFYNHNKELRNSYLGASDLTTEIGSSYVQSVNIGGWFVISYFYGSNWIKNNLNNNAFPWNGKDKVINFSPSAGRDLQSLPHVHF